MTLDCDRYRINVPLIKKLTEDKTESERMELIGMLSIRTYVHILIVACYVGELYGFTDELKSFIERTKKFYRINNILNIKSVA